MTQLRAAIVLCMVIWTSVVRAEPPEVFSNPTAGLTVTKPPTWHYVTAAEHSENLKAMKLNDQHFHAAMLKYTTTPLVAMTKFPEPFADINPSFKVNIKPWGHLKGKRPTELLTLVLPQWHRAFQDFQLVESPTEVEVSGIPSAYARINYSLLTADGRVFPSTSELWIVPHGDYFFLLGAGTRQDETTGTRAEIRAIVDSVKIEE